MFFCRCFFTRKKMKMKNNEMTRDIGTMFEFEIFGKCSTNVWLLYINVLWTLLGCLYIIYFNVLMSKIVDVIRKD